MRKVTASAVLLTAITGCAQSKAPTPQWSYEVPNSNETASLANSSSDLALPLALSDDAQAFVDLASQQLVDPAFESKPFAQSGSVDLETPVTAVPLPNIPAPKAELRIEAGGAEAGGVDAGDSVTISSADALIEAYSAPRPDPVAEARAYLSRNSPALITNRTPYSSAQVYLPSSPAAAPISDLTPIAPTLAAFNPPAANLSASGTTPDLVTVDIVSASAARDSATDALPSLLPQPPVSQSDAMVASAAIRDVAIAEDVPLGTAILMSMQQDSVESSIENSPQTFAATPPNLDLAHLTGSSTDSNSSDPRLAPATDSLPVLSLSPNEQADRVATVPTEALASLPLQEVEQTLTDSVISSVPGPATSSRPTLASLIQSMPERDSSPLVEQVQATSTLVSESSIAESTFFEPATAESTIYLPIADDLSAQTSSTIYLPIADDVDAPISSLASSIQGVISTLGREASTAKFIDRLDLDDVETDSTESLSSQAEELFDETESSPGLAQAIAEQITEIPRSLSLHSHPAVRRPDTATQKGIPVFKVDESAATKITNLSRSLGLRPDVARRLSATTQRAIPIFKVDRKASRGYRPRAFWQ